MFHGTQRQGSWTYAIPHAANGDDRYALNLVPCDVAVVPAQRPRISPSNTKSGTRPRCDVTAVSTSNQVAETGNDSLKAAQQYLALRVADAFA